MDGDRPGHTNHLVLAIAALKVILHAATSARGYGYFGDELYYLACARRLDWGYVDHPPLSIALLDVWTSVFGDSLVSIRMLAALLGGAAVALAGPLARELGGGARAQAITALVVALAPVHLVVHGYYSMNAIDILFWMTACIAIARIARRPTASRWLGLGLLLGLGLWNKLSLLWLGAGLGLGLLATPHRRALATPWPWLAGGLALLVFSPHLVWQALHGFPTLEFVSAATATKMVRVGAFDLFSQQALVMLPVTLPIWIAGFFWLWRDAEGPGRLLAIVFATTAAILVANGASRPNYLALAQPPLVAGGAVWIEQLGERARWRWLPATAIALVALVGLALSPLSIPVLPPDDLVEMRRAVGLGAPRMENRAVGQLDPHFADMIGWGVIVDAVADVWATLPEAERARATIYAPSYGFAGAIEQLGAERGLPVPVSPHNSYWGWGPGDPDATIFVVVAAEADELRALFDSVEEAGTWDCGLCMPGHNHRKIFIARTPRAPVPELWARLRRYL